MILFICPCQSCVFCAWLILFGCYFRYSFCYFIFRVWIATFLCLSFVMICISSAFFSLASIQLNAFDYSLNNIQCVVNDVKNHNKQVFRNLKQWFNLSANSVLFAYFRLYIEHGLPYWRMQLTPSDKWTRKISHIFVWQKKSVKCAD